jgi:hypothetical protein
MWWSPRGQRGWSRPSPWREPVSGAWCSTAGPRFHHCPGPPRSASEPWSCCAPGALRHRSAPVVMRLSCGCSRSLDPRGSRGEVRNELEVDLGGRIPHRWLSSGPGRIPSLDPLTPGLTWLTTDSSCQHSAGGAMGAAAPVTVRRLDPDTAEALGVRQPGGLLVRPDGIVWSSSASTSRAPRRARARLTR